MEQETLVAGETLIDFVPSRPGPLEDVASFDRRPGGAPANVAVGLARLGEPPLFWTRVGADPFGRFLERTLADAGLPDRFVERDPDAKTTLAFVTHDAEGDREFTFYRDAAADARLEPGRIGDHVLEDLEWIHVGGVTLAASPAREATLDLLERASAAGCSTSFDPNYRPELWPDAETFARTVTDALAHVDVCAATVDELERLGFEPAGSGTVDSSASRLGQAVLEDGTGGPDRGWADGPHTVFVTRGAEGAVVVTSSRAPWPSSTSPDPTTATHPGFDVDAVDATGAGDAFVAGAIAALREGRSLEDALAFANAVAATATTDAEGMAAVPTRTAVEELLEDT